MDVYIACKEYFRESVEVQNAIIKSVKALFSRIQNYEKQNVSFDQIFNDDKVKYDKHGRFYTFKSHQTNLQLRILYSYIIVDFKPVIIVADFFIKKKNSKNYIDRFNYVNMTDPFEMLKKSKAICMN